MITSQFDCVRVSEEPWDLASLPSWLKQAMLDQAVARDVHPKNNTQMVAVFTAEGPHLVKAGEWLVLDPFGEIVWMVNGELEQIIQRRVDRHTMRLTVNLETEQ